MPYTDPLKRKAAVSRYRLEHAESIRNYMRAWREAHKEEIRSSKKQYYEATKVAVLTKRRKEKYGISEEEYQTLLALQLFRCAICGKSSKRRLHIDHDHVTNAVRGLLCSTCNTGLGQFKDDPVLLAKAIDYLRH